MSIIYEPEYRMLIDCLKECRLRSKMTQHDLASRLGRSQAYVSKYEQCQKRLDIIEIKKICMCLNISLVEFITEFEERATLGGM